MQLAIGYLDNHAPTITNVDCVDFELEYEDTYSCQVTLTETDPRDTIYIVTDPMLYGFPMEVETGTQTITFLNENSNVGEFNMKVNVRDDNWGDDPVGETKARFSE